MRKVIYPKFSLMLLLLATAVGCTDRAEQPPSLTRKYPPAALREDAEQVVRVATKYHPAMYDFTSRNDYEQLVKRQLASITDSLTLPAFYRIVSPLVTKIGCGHSNLGFPESVWQDSATGVLPLRLFFERGSGYVITNVSADQHLAAGTELLAINGQPIPDLLGELSAYLSTDGNNASAKRAVLNSPAFNGFLGIHAGFPKNYTLRLRPAKSDSVYTTTVPAMRVQTYDASLPQPDSILQVAVDSVRSSAAITIRSFGFYDRYDAFKRFVDSSFHHLHRARIRHLILDLRGNRGGDPRCAAYLLTYLCPKPVVYFAKPYSNYLGLDQPMPPAANRFAGRLDVLIDGFCFSTTGHLCALLRYHRIGRFIGSESGGTYTCNDNSQTYRLINTGLLLRMAHLTYTVAVRGIPRFQGIRPDQSIEPTLDDLRTRKDRTKEFARQRK